MLRGLPDTIVHLKILHGDQYVQYDLTREVQKFVTSHMLPGESVTLHPTRSIKQPANR